MGTVVEAGVHVQGQNVEFEGHDALAQAQDIEQHEAVHSAGHGHPHPGAGLEHGELAHELAGLAHAHFLGVGGFFFLETFERH